MSLIFNYVFLLLWMTDYGAIVGARRYLRDRHTPSKPTSPKKAIHDRSPRCRTARWLLLLASCGRQQEAGETTYNLPSELNEVSGLAAAGPDSVFTHDDEFAIVYEFRLTDGHILRTFALGDPTIEGDFEGIAAADGRVFLVTSDGLIYSAAPGENGKRVPYRVYDSGVGPRCEVEGLSQAPTAGRPAAAVQAPAQRSR